MKLATILEAVSRDNDHAAWDRLLRFCSRCFRSPPRGGHRRSLAMAINRQLSEETNCSTTPPTSTCSKQTRGPPQDPLKTLASRVSSKLEEGDFKGAVKLACSEDTIADMSIATLSALQQKHPSPHPDSCIPPLPQGSVAHTVSVSVEEVAKAIRSFPNGSAGGPDGLRPQHLKDMVGPSTAGGGHVLLSALASFLSLVLAGRTPPSFRPYFFGANLIALQKKDGGVRPIAVGCTLRRLAAKVASGKVLEDMAALLAPHQLGYGVKGGAEAAVHSARLFLHNLKPQQVLLKLDFKNAFNSLRRDKLLATVRILAPDLLPFVHSSYSLPSFLFWGDKRLQSSEGVQQGDPLGPLLFCLSLYQLHSQVKSEFCVFYLDDVTLGGNLEDVLHDLGVFERVAAELGLLLNHCKSEVICSDQSMRASILASVPEVRVVDPSDACLLGSPIGDVGSISNTIDEKVHLLEIMGDRLQHLAAHDAIFLLRHSFAIPKLLYTLRTSPCFLSPNLKLYDDRLRSIVSTITNIHFAPNDPAWTQASLPVKFGGLGIRSAVQLAPSAFLASAAGSSDLAHHILPSHLQNVPLPNVADAAALWSQDHDHPPPVGTASHCQKTWDAHKVSATADSLLESASNATSIARLLAASTRESGAWLNALPISSLGLRMDNNTIRVAVGLRLGSPLCRPHTCHHCGAAVDHLATHGLSCRWSEGRHHRHAAINDILHRALSSAKIPSRLEPSGLYRSDGKRPDGITIVPWKNGKLLVWDATCPDTYAPSYSAFATSEAGVVAAQAEERKCSKYCHLLSSHSFAPVAIETSGAIGPRTSEFLWQLGRRLRQVTGEVKSTTYLLQRLSVAIQRGNAASVLGTISHSADLEDFL